MDKSKAPAKGFNYEFGGPLGCAGIIVASHCLMVYLWASFEFYNGTPAPLSGVLHHLLNDFQPNWFAFKLYAGFFAFQLITAAVVPGFKVTSVPRADRPNKKEYLIYNCNAIQAWYITLIGSAVCQYFGIFNMASIIENLGPLTIISVVFADCVAIIAYVSAIVTGNAYHMSGNVVYDFFIGAWLHPRLGPVDLKMFSEIRWSWFILFNLSLSSAVHQYQTYGYVSVSMVFIVVAHWLYTNACAKGEDLVTGAYDLVYEKWGWLLIFWNFAGVPFLYCASSVYMAKVPPFVLHPLHYAVCFFLLIVGYYVLDTANAQKNSFRMRLSNPNWKPRGTFPQLPWAYLSEKADYMKTEAGSCLLTDGWWRYARKPHYTGDLMMSASWGLITGFDSILPYIYCISFFFILLHRRIRDETRCKEKYKADWDKYEAKVPYVYIPYVY
eukprot:TRINITY_DN13282_c0_g1_i1.p1 TRINITY_DN13282_c0_g1~~TRINITY_DN13282_c0_g1_i1.p1  ORF type:complete len:440 (-),score=89.24 TRINITY_DN13282_c0_g1_i1:30-1349(-)